MSADSVPASATVSPTRSAAIAAPALKLMSNPLFISVSLFMSGKPISKKLRVGFDAVVEL